MPLMDWDKTLLLGVDPFDGHHKHLFSLLNRIYDLITCNAPTSSYEDVFSELKDYTIYHFEAEELWMKDLDYPQMQVHIQQHKLFMNEIARFENELTVGGAMVSIGMLTFIKEWLLNHIYKIDAEYAAHLRSKEISG